jgi:hypothetical protein
MDRDLRIYYSVYLASPFGATHSASRYSCTFAVHSMTMNLSHNAG